MVNLSAKIVLPNISVFHMEDGKINAEIAMDHRFVITADRNISAEIVKAQEFATTVGGKLGAATVVVPHFATTVGKNTDVEIVMALESVNTISASPLVSNVLQIARSSVKFVGYLPSSKRMTTSAQGAIQKRQAIKGQKK